jgi:V/A-type H+-transporting ATPase subunit I
MLGMGKANLCKVAVISPRSEYQTVSRKIAEFRDFHIASDVNPSFDSRMQELDTRAVRLYALADQIAKDLGLQQMPGTVDLIFRGVKVNKKVFEAKDWNDLLSKAENVLLPVAKSVYDAKSRLQKVQKEIAETKAMLELVSLVSSHPIDLTRLNKLRRLGISLVILQSKAVTEFLNSIPETISKTEKLSDVYTLVLVAFDVRDKQKIEKAIKAFSGKELALPSDLPQDTFIAYRKLNERLSKLQGEQKEVLGELNLISSSSGDDILAVLELAEICRDALDEIRVSGNMRRFAVISGYIPEERESEFKASMSQWIVHTNRIEKQAEENTPTLMRNNGAIKPFELLTSEQGIPSQHEVDPTPIISFVFPVFFGLMFGDFGHGIVLTLFSLLLIKRGVGSIKEWGKIFLAAGISATFFGAIFGEFFGFSLHQLLPIPTLLEIVHREGQIAQLDSVGVINIVLISIFIGVAHLITALGLNLVESIKAGEIVETIVSRIPTFVMYVGGILFGFAFVGANYTFNVLNVDTPVDGTGIPTNLFGKISLVLIFGSMVFILFGKAVAIATGKVRGESIAGSIAMGALEVFERILQFSANTISYVRLGVMLLIHASLLLIVNQYTPLTNPLTAVPWVIFNILIITFEALVVYIQDLRLHVYEFFTKFYEGNGIPFKRIFPERIRIKINWT